MSQMNILTKFGSHTQSEVLYNILWVLLAIFALGFGYFYCNCGENKLANNDL